MNVALKAVVLLCGVLFIVTGLRWLLAPAGVAPEFGLALSTGVGLSSQIGDMSAFFLTLGVSILDGAHYPACYLVLPAHHFALADCRWTRSGLAAA